MSTQTITGELRRWIQDHAQAGTSRETILQSMCASGWSQSVALQALAETLDGASPELPPPLPVPEPDLRRSPAEIQLSDRRVQVLLRVEHPRVVVFGGLLSHEECDAMVAAATRRLARSETVANDKDGSEINAARTSEGMFFERAENEICARVEARIAELLHWPVENGEGLQVLHYRAGAEYLPHYDYFDPTHASTPAILARGGQRVGTLVMYLNTPEQGGSTVFPDIKLDVAPIKGNAVFFSYERAHPSTLTLHGGSPVLAGEKWVATKWMREREFT